MTLSKYHAYKSSGIDWINEAPDHWKVQPLRRLISAPLTNGIFKKSEQFGSGTPLINVFDIYRNDFLVSFDTLDRVICTKTEVAAYKVLAGDLFFVRSSLKPEGIAAVAVAGHCDETAVFECHLVRARPNPTRLHSRFASYLLNSSYYRSMMVANAKITTMTTIDQEAILSIPMLVPSLSEQVAIAAFLDRETAKINALVDKEQQLLELLKEKMVSLALSFKDFAETQELRLEHVARIISRPVIQREGEIYTPIGLFNRGRGLFHKDPREMNEMGDSDFFWVEAGDLIISGQFAWEGAVALAEKEDAGCVVSHRYPVLRGKPGIAMTEYLLALLLTKHGDFLLNENSRGAAGRNRPLNINSLMKEKILVPDLQTQEKVARAVHTKNKLFREISKQIELLNQRRAALISAVVTGKIDARGLVEVDWSIPDVVAA